jgi:hypothetical protein
MLTSKDVPGQAAAFGVEKQMRESRASPAADSMRANPTAAEVVGLL